MRQMSLPAKKRCTLLLSLFAAGLAAQTFTPSNLAALAARQWRTQHDRAIIDEFVTLLAIPNIAADRANIQRNAETISNMMEKTWRGIEAGDSPRRKPRRLRRDQDARRDAHCGFLRALRWATA